MNYVYTKICTGRGESRFDHHNVNKSSPGKWYWSHYQVCVFLPSTLDFGMAQNLTINEVAESFRGSPLYMVLRVISFMYMHEQGSA